MKTGLTPSASGSAYFELEPSSTSASHALSLQDSPSTIKLTCTVHGPKPLQRSAPFTPHALISTHVKFAPFAARQRRGHIRDPNERDLAVHLETALRGVVISDRWPKSGIEVVVTVLESDEDAWTGDETPMGGTRLAGAGGVGMMNVLAGCITVASVAIADAGIDCVDLVVGGVAGVLEPSGREGFDQKGYLVHCGDNVEVSAQIIRDPCPYEQRSMIAACVVGYLGSRDELTELWFKGNFHGPACGTFVGARIEDALMDQAIASALETRLVLEAAVLEAVERRSQQISPDANRATPAGSRDQVQDVPMTI